MGTSARQDQEFIRQVISSTLLEDAIDWISNNMNPEEVFSDRQLEQWAKENNFVKDEGD